MRYAKLYRVSYSSWIYLTRRAEDYLYLHIYIDERYEGNNIKRGLPRVIQYALAMLTRDQPGMNSGVPGCSRVRDGP